MRVQDYVRQPTPTACGQAVVAMILGCPVEHVLSVLPSRDRGTTIGELRDLLRLAGCKTDSRLRCVGVRIAPLAILRYSKPGVRLGHWSLWADGYEHDPADVPARRWADYRLTSTLWVRR